MHAEITEITAIVRNMIFPACYRDQAAAAPAINVVTSLHDVIGVVIFSSFCVCFLFSPRDATK